MGGIVTTETWREIFPQNIKVMHAAGTLTLDDLFEEFDGVNIFRQFTATCAAVRAVTSAGH